MTSYSATSAMVLRQHERKKIGQLPASIQLAQNDMMHLFTQSSQCLTERIQLARRLSLQAS